jgi:prepilin-type processing-associated H-X9-DG protein
VIALRFAYRDSSGFDRLPPSVRRIRGLTILELLIITGSIGTLTALLLPAISTTREAGRNSECADRLHQIGVAFHGYHDVYGVLPAGWETEPSNTTGFGWAAAILPQLGEETLSRQIDRRRPIDEVSQDVRATTPAVFLCPSDYGHIDFPLFAEIGAHGSNAQLSTKTLVTLPRANYMAVFGTAVPDKVPGDSGDGVFIAGRGFRLNEIHKGLRHVMFVGERTTRKLSSTWLGISLAGEDAGGRVLGHAYEGPNRDESDECEFDSRHDGHVNFVWADGHVSSIHDDIDVQVYRQCAQRR